MDLGLKGRTAFITGGSKGIGKNIAKGLAAEGVNVVLLARNKEALEDFDLVGRPFLRRRKSHV